MPRPGTGTTKRSGGGEIPGQPVSFHFWAVDGADFLGEFQLRTENTEVVLSGIGHIGYAVRVSRQGRGWGTEILRQGLNIAREKGMKKVLLNINSENRVSRHVCEKPGGRLMDEIPSCTAAEGAHMLCRYWSSLADDEG